MVVNSEKEEPEWLQRMDKIYKKQKWRVLQCDLVESDEKVVAHFILKDHHLMQNAASSYEMTTMSLDFATTCSFKIKLSGFPMLANAKD